MNATAQARFDIEILEPLLLMSASPMDCGGCDMMDFHEGTSGGDIMSLCGDSGSLIGGAGDDVLMGNEGNNLLSGGSGDDLLISGDGCDVLMGGEGNDTAVYWGNRADYQIQSLGENQFSVRHGHQTDFVSDVENFQFRDGTVSAAQLIAAVTSGTTPDNGADVADTETQESSGNCGIENSTDAAPEVAGITLADPAPVADAPPEPVLLEDVVAVGEPLSITEVQQDDAPVVADAPPEPVLLEDAPVDDSPGVDDSAPVAEIQIVEPAPVADAPPEPVLIQDIVAVGESVSITEVQQDDAPVLADAPPEPVIVEDTKTEDSAPEVLANEVLADDPASQNVAQTTAENTAVDVGNSDPVAEDDKATVRVNVPEDRPERVQVITLNDLDNQTLELRNCENGINVFDFNTTSELLTEDVWFAENDDPTATADEYATTEEAPVTGNVLENDFDVNGDSLNVELQEGPAQGQLTLNADGTFEYVPATGFVGQDTFRYSISDGNGGTDDAVVTITVAEDVSISVASASITGTTVIHEGDAGQYRVELDQPVAEDTWFEIKAKDGTANLVQHQADNQDTIWGGWYDTRWGIGGEVADVIYGRVPNGTSVSTGNREMVGTADSSWDYSLAQDGVVVNGDSVWVKVEAGQTSSSSFDVQTWLEQVTVDRDNGNTAGYNEGTEQFSLTIVSTKNTDLVNVDQDTVDVDIIDKTDYQYVSPIGLDLNGDGKIGVTGETSAQDKSGISQLGTTVSFDIDNDGSADTIEWFSGDGDGILVDNRDGNAADDMHGGRLFGDEGGRFANGYEKLSQLDVDGSGDLTGSELDGLEAWVDDGDSIAEEGEFRTLQDLGIFSLKTSFNNVQNAAGETLMQSAASMDAEAAGLVHYEISGADADLFVIDAQSGEMRFLAAPDYEQPLDSDADNLYEVTLERTINGRTVSQHIQISVCDKVARDSTGENVSATGNVLENDSDANGDCLTTTLVSGPQNGTVTLNTDGSYEYTPHDNFTGLDIFIYQVDDGQGGTDTAEVCIEVRPDSNVDPTAADDSNSTVQDVSVSGTVASNDSDADGDTLTYALSEGALNGVVALADDGSYTYTPNAGFCGQDTFTYEVSDGNGGTATATVSLNIDPPPNADPEANDDSFSTDQDNAVTGNVLDNDADADGDTLTVTAAVDLLSSEGGIVTLQEDGSFIYRPAAGFTGTDTFAYTLTDGEGGSATAAVNITVNEIPVPEPVVSQEFEGDQTSSIEGDVTPDDDRPVVSLQAGPTNGTLTLNADGTFRYVPNDGFTGEDSFTYVITTACGNSRMQESRLVIAEVQWDTTYESAGNGRIWGDPHFEGDDGGLYDVQGEANHIYNLLSDKQLQLNALFIPYDPHPGSTMMGAIGATVGSDLVLADLTGTQVNGVTVQAGETVNINNGTVHFDGEFTTLTTDEYRLVFHKRDGWMDMRLKALDPFSDNVAPHGLWGLTVDGDTEARNGDFYKDNFDYTLQGGGAIDTVDADGNVVVSERGDDSTFRLYETADLFSKTAMYEDGASFFRFDARQGTGLQTLE